MLRSEIINKFIERRGLSFTNYLEIGTDAGDCFRNINAPVRISVDPNPKSTASYVMTSDEFFDLSRQNESPVSLMRFDIVFIDGLHEHNQVWRDITNALTVLNPNGIIILHDCLPTSERMQEYHDTPQTGYAWTGDVWKAFVKARAELPYYMYTIPEDMGCGIIDTSVQSKKRKSSAFALPTDMDAMTYSDFLNNPKWMNVISTTDWLEYMNPESGTN